MRKHESAGRSAARRSAADGRALIDQWRRSGMSVTEFCRDHAVAPHVLRYWLSREKTPTQPVATASKFFVVSAPGKKPETNAASTPLPSGSRRAGAIVVLLPALTPGELMESLRGLLEEARS
jgi:transposase-like protein